MNEILELAPVEKDIDLVLRKSGGGNCTHHRGETRKEGNLVMARWGRECPERAI